ncbi:26S proteasome non-ATPase regulatory subunit 9, partial [Sciurus carolinensis]|nr:26S proteasome non-ATPase regulatory subunit 9 [Sciurus carolinensis]
IHELMRCKEEIKAQIKANYDMLEDQKGVGLNKLLGDLEGYPAADVDLNQVYTARHSIICLQSECKEGMKQVEVALHQLHARDKQKQAWDLVEAHEEAMSCRLSHSLGQSEQHQPGSPASIAGLQVDGEMVTFGSVNTQNFQSLHNVGNVVQHSEGRPLNVTVVRRDERHLLQLLPTRWAGKGLLGCNIIPLQR